MELVVEDGVFVTMAADAGPAGAMLIRDGRIAAIGQAEAVRAAAPGAAVVRLGGATVVPGTDPRHPGAGHRPRRNPRLPILRHLPRPLTGPGLLSKEPATAPAQGLRQRACAPATAARPHQRHPPAAWLPCSVRVTTSVSACPPTGGGWTGTARGGSSARPPAAPGSPRPSRPTR